MEQNGWLQRRNLDFEETEPGTRVGHAMVTLENKVTTLYIIVFMLHTFYLFFIPALTGFVSALTKSLDAKLIHVYCRYLYMEDTRSPW